jgi:uncharacterized damage-inducible protein DinB
MELQEIRQHLKETRDGLLEMIKDLSEEQLNKRKDPRSWSIGQVCQHLSRTEELYVMAIKKALKGNEDSLVENKPLQFMLDRSHKWEAPDIARPTDEIVRAESIIDKLRHSRERLNEVLNAVEDPSLLNRRHFTHPVFKEMLLSDWVKSLYLHEQRHMEQIKEGLSL